MTHRETFEEGAKNAAAATFLREQRRGGCSGTTLAQATNRKIFEEDTDSTAGATSQNDQRTGMCSGTTHAQASLQRKTGKEGNFSTGAATMLAAAESGMGSRIHDTHKNAFTKIAYSAAAAVFTQKKRADEYSCTTQGSRDIAERDSKLTRRVSIAQQQPRCQ